MLTRATVLSTCIAKHRQDVSLVEPKNLKSVQNVSVDSNLLLGLKISSLVSLNDGEPNFPLSLSKNKAFIFSMQICNR